MPRIELRDGQWAKLRERITHGQDKAISRAFRAGRDDPDRRPDFTTVLVREFVATWYVNDPAGVLIPLADQDAINRAPSDIVDQLADAALPLWNEVTVPNAPTPPPSESSPSAAD